MQKVLKISKVFCSIKMKKYVVWHVINCIQTLIAEFLKIVWCVTN